MTNPHALLSRMYKNFNESTTSQIELDVVEMMTNKIWLKKLNFICRFQYNIIITS